VIHICSKLIKEWHREFEMLNTLRDEDGEAIVGKSPQQDILSFFAWVPNKRWRVIIWIPFARRTKW
jgi:hypothetical protein